MIYFCWLLSHGGRKKRPCPERYAGVLIKLGQKPAFPHSIQKNDFIVNYSNEIWWVQLGSVDSTVCVCWGVYGWRMIMFLCVSLHRKFLLLQVLHNAYWNFKDNKSSIIDCTTVLEGFCEHQSHLQCITGTAANFYHAEQTEMDSSQQLKLYCCVWDC